jgi:hypothetical protein
MGQLTSAPSDDLLNAHMSTLYGPTGLAKVATASTVDLGSVEVGTSYGKQFSATANYGLLDSLEVGVGVLDRTGDSDAVLANAKVSIVPANMKGFVLGLGILDAFDQADRTVYAVASLDLITPNEARKWSGLRGHLGYGTGLYNDTVIGGAEAFLSQKVSVIGEYDGEDANVAVRYVHDKAVRLELGYQDSRFYFSTSSSFNP